MKTRMKTGREISRKPSTRELLAVVVAESSGDSLELAREVRASWRLTESEAGELLKLRIFIGEHPSILGH